MSIQTEGKARPLRIEAIDLFFDQSAAQQDKRNPCRSEDSIIADAIGSSNHRFIPYFCPHCSITKSHRHDQILL